ncbi:MAG: DNA polymerase III subunit delta [Muribaculaceae bacterium]|nr:DNA polymerase III subunit delta [Muribaculaceae bacterium]
MQFNDIPAHESVKSRLRAMADSDRIPHALMLEGPQGSGKFALMRAFAQYIHCTGRQPGDTDSCGKCPSCIQHAGFGHIDTHFVFPVVKLEKMTYPPVSDDFIEAWKDYLTTHSFMDFSAWADSFDKKNSQPITYVTESDAIMRKLSFAAHGSRYKIVLWWLPEKMNVEAVNKILKLLEEPWEDTIFLMACDNPGEMLPTIYSRVQRISTTKLPDSAIAGILETERGLSHDDAMAIAHNADGSATAAFRSLAAQSDEKEFFDLFVYLMRQAYQRKIADLKEWGANLAGMGREKELKFYEYAVRLIRENFIYNFKLPQLNYLNSAESAFSTKFARFITERNVEKLIEVFENARIDIAGNANGKIVNLDVAIKVILLLKQ